MAHEIAKMPNIDATLITAVSAILVATISWILTIIGGRKKADVQSSLNDGFEILVRELQKNPRN